MRKKYEKENLEFARNLRKNMTKEERHLWYDYLSTYPVRFKKQKILGRYIADFYCADANLVVELDGRQHSTEEGKEHDRKRTEYLEQYGITVLRFKNYQVNDSFRLVCERIDFAVKKSLKQENR